MRKKHWCDRVEQQEDYTELMIIIILYMWYLCMCSIIIQWQCIHVYRLRYNKKMFICYVYGHITVKHKARVTIIEHKEPKILHVKKWKLLCRLHTTHISVTLH